MLRSLTNIAIVKISMLTNPICEIWSVEWNNRLNFLKQNLSDWPWSSNVKANTGAASDGVCFCYLRYFTSDRNKLKSIYRRAARWIL